MTIWLRKYTKVIHLQYCKKWERPHFAIYTNGGKRKNGDTCFDFNIHFWKFAFWYTNYDLQKRIKNRRVNKCQIL